MDIAQFAYNILNGTSLDDKLLSPDITQLSFEKPSPLVALTQPARSKKIQLTNKQIKFPKGHFHKPEKVAIALNSFANHELLAIEIMANMLILLPHETAQQRQFKKGIFSTLKDEQVHLDLYVKRLNEVGYEFGDFPLNDYFWRQCQKIQNACEYLSLMSITFEGANLDFAAVFRDEFERVEDFKTAKILERVLLDEISHVAFGVNWLKKWRGQKSLWEYYLHNLPFPVTAARAKGKHLNMKDRVKAKMDDSFLNLLKKYRDDFQVTTRKEWK